MKILFWILLVATLVGGYFVYQNYTEDAGNVHSSAPKTGVTSFTEDDIQGSLPATGRSLE